MLHASSKHIPLRRRILGAGAWSMGGYALRQALRFGGNLLMTRLLAPEMFGVVAIAYVIATGLTLFSDMGVRQNIVQSHRGNDPVFLNTAWVAQILRGIVLWILSLFVAAFVIVANRHGFFAKTSVYADPILPVVIAVSSFMVVIEGLVSTKLFEASRYLSLGRVTGIEIANQIAALVSMVAWVAVDRSVWALVAGGLFGSATRTILSHVWLPGHANRWQWDKSCFSEIFHFGKWIFMASVLGFVAMNGDRIVLGGLIDTKLFGVYAIAFFMFNSISRAVRRLITDVTFPVLSEVGRERVADLKRVFNKFHAATAAFSYVCAGLLTFSGQALVSHLYDPRYAEAGWMLEILAFALLATPSSIIVVYLTAIGSPKINSHIIAMRLIALIVFVPLGFYLFGLAGAIWGVTASYLVNVPVGIFYQIKYRLFDLTQELMIIPAYVVGALLGLGLDFGIKWAFH